MALIDDLLNLVARPAETTLGATALRNAVTYLHKTGFYWKDLYEISEPIATANLEIQLALPINFRAWKYIRPKYASGTYGPLLTRIEPEQAFATIDRAQTQTLQQDVYYNAGLNCNLRLSRSVVGVLIAYYGLPKTALANYTDTDWLCIQYPNLVLNQAAAYIYTVLENEALASVYSRLVAQELQQLMINECIDEVGP